MENLRPPSLLYRLQPYVLISLAAIIACLPVSSMLFTLKNDVLAIEYPVQHFISEALRHGENPVWFNSWCMGFPLQSVLTWSVFSTPRTIIGILLPSDVGVLQIEFVLYVMSAGWVMFALLKKHVNCSRDFSMLLACCYMLSGFTVGSSQWLLYITGMTFIPFSVYCALNLVRTPSLLRGFYFAVSYFLLLTNVHIYLTVFASYMLAGLFILKIVNVILNKSSDIAFRRRLWRSLSWSFLLVLLFSAAPLYYTYELLQWLERSAALESSGDFFRSNYLHPDAFKSLLLPLSTVKQVHYNTEGSVQNIYMGLLPFFLFIPSLIQNYRSRNKAAWWILGFAGFFLMLSFGHLTPLRAWLNIMPGLSYFRHPAVLRVFFIMAFLIYLGISFRDFLPAGNIRKGSPAYRYALYALSATAMLLLFILFRNREVAGDIWKGSVMESTRKIEHSQLIILNSIIQFFFILGLLAALIKKQQWIAPLVITDLVINFLVCTPFYTISSFSVKEVNQIFHYTRGFPVQQECPSAVPAELSSGDITVWRNVNTYQKKISSAVSMPGPLVLDQMGKFISSPRINRLLDKPLVFIDSTKSARDSLQVISQKPGKINVLAELTAPREIVLQQAYFPGWEVFYNGKKIPMLRDGSPLIRIIAPAGKGEISFRFRKNGVLFSALILHLVLLLSVFKLLGRKKSFRSFSLS